jgi:hypothetical protein
MRKIYRYEKLSYAGEENEAVVLKIKSISVGNTSHTTINMPNDIYKEIENSGQKKIGVLEELLSERTLLVSDIANPVPEVDTIIIEYYINSTLLVRHENLKSETDQPYIFIKIKFTKK